MIPETHIPRTTDFTLSGNGKAAEWQKADWLALAPVKTKTAFLTRAKALYSRTGLYFLCECEDARLACTMTRDGDDLFKEDVIEVFLQPDAGNPVYFEYEISPLGAELPLLVANRDGRFHGWLPWHYEGPRKSRRATTVRGGKKVPQGTCDGWTAEFFLPFALLHGLIDRPPRPGDCWRGNICRIDYDGGKPRHWTWSPATKANFHAFKQFGIFRFI